MNAAAKALAQGSFDIHNISAVIFSARALAFVLLIIAVLATGFSVVSVKNMNRHLVYELTSLQKDRDALHLQWGQLLLEQNTWATQARVQHIAQSQLGMGIPAPQSVVILKAKK